MTRRKTHELTCGSLVMYDGALVRIEEIAGTQILLCEVQENSTASVSMVRFLSSVHPVDADQANREQDLAISLSTKQEQQAAADLARDLRRVIQGTEAVTAGQVSAAPGIEGRRKALAVKRGVTTRTVSRWMQKFQSGGEPALISRIVTRKRRSRVDPRWDEQVHLTVGRLGDLSTFTRDYVLEMIEDALVERFGEGVVQIPSRTTQYERLKALTKGTNAFTGSSKARRSIADGPKGAFGRLRAARPGQYAILDTTPLDIFVMEPVTLRWCKADLTVVQDLYTRAIIALRVTAQSTKAHDVAGVLYEACHPVQGPETVPEDARWRYHGLPENLVFTEDTTLWGVPLCPPETIVIDRGRAFLSAHVLGVCQRLGITVMPAQPYKPTDKPTVERFFGSLRTGLIERLPAYTGPDVYSRGKNPEAQTFLYLHELEDIIREWVAVVYHTTVHQGLCVPQWPSLDLSPNRMYELGLGSSGLMRLPVDTTDLYDFLDVRWRTIQRYGVEIGNKRYDGPELDPYRNTTSEFGGTEPGKWPFRVDVTDCRAVYFQDPVELTWHTLLWEHGTSIEEPFSDEAYQHARSIADGDDLPDKRIAMKKLMARWSEGAVESRRERRIAIQMSAERAALPTSQITPETLFERHTGVSTATEDQPLEVEFVDELDDVDQIDKDAEFEESHHDLDLDDDYMEISS